MTAFFMYKINKIYDMNLENVAIIFNLDNLELIHYKTVYSYCFILKFKIVFITTDVYNEDNYKKIFDILKKSGINLTHDIYFRKRDTDINKYKNNVSKNIISKGFIIALIIESEICYYITEDNLDIKLYNGNQEENENINKNINEKKINNILGTDCVQNMLNYEIDDIIEEETEYDIQLEKNREKGNSISLTVISHKENENKNLESSIAFINNHLYDSISSSKKLQNFVDLEFKKDIIKEEDIILTDEILGTGTFTKVYLGAIKKTKVKIAVKKIKIEDNEKIINLAKEEIMLMSKLNHPNILSYLGLFQNGKYLYIYTEYVQGGNMSSLIKKHGSFKDESIIKKFVKEILNGIVYLHENRIIHRDIKCSNILINKDIIKLADFGCTFCFDDSNTYKNAILSGTVPWMAPEMIKKEKFGNKIDIWSLGCTIVEMLNGERPWIECPTVARIFYMVSIELEKPIIKNEKNLSKELKNFINDCLQHDPAIRPTSKFLQSHKFLN
jgi:tRNA A-37 threonylcarbamoyl transferase component Bud32